MILKQNRETKHQYVYLGFYINFMTLANRNKMNTFRRKILNQNVKYRYE